MESLREMHKKLAPGMAPQQGAVSGVKTGVGAESLSDEVRAHVRMDPSTKRVG